jgi:Lipase (class 3)
MMVASCSSGSSPTAATAAASVLYCVTVATVVAAFETNRTHQQHQPHHRQQHHHPRYLYYDSNKTFMEEEAPKKNGLDTGSEEASRKKKDLPGSSFWETLVTDVKEMKKNLDEVMSDVNELLKPDDDKPTTSRRAKEASSSPSSSSSQSSSSTSSSPVDSLSSLGSALLKLWAAGGGGGGGGEGDKVYTAEEIIQRARENAASATFQHENDISNSQQDGSTLLSVLQILDTYKDKLDQVADLYMGSIDASKISPTALYYYVEHEDEVKNPSWKRRMHRYYPGIDVSKMQEINDACDLAFMAYADNADEIQEALAHFRIPYALVSANVVSQPGKPASFLAVKKKLINDDSFSSSSSPLEVLLCVRGTKTIADAVTDVICNVEPYRGGTAHALILQSGRYLAQEYAPLLHQLLKLSGKSNINLILIGHSMGAGAATIAGIELGDDDTINVQQVVGFGCPALLSKDLAEKVSPFVSTIISDNDMIVSRRFLLLLLLPLVCV